ncbi:hypothetical protein [Caulobacter sp. 1776]|uniref:hypothetical protein n=1 Tax=Caulobacter sp. 1776 TaxID=3156420 RepID=UPI003395DA10
MQPNPTLSLIGLWTPVSVSQLSANYSGGLAMSLSALVSTPAGYGVVFTGWTFPNQAPADPYDVTIAFLTPGAAALSTSAIANPVIEGTQSVLTADFNGDGRSDIVLLPYNEKPFAAAAGTAFMSNASGGYDRVTLPGAVNAHDAEVAYVNGRPVIVTATMLGTADQHANAIFGYANGAWSETVSPTLNKPGFGNSEALAAFGTGGAYRLVRGDNLFDYSAPGVAGASDIAVYAFDTASMGLVDTTAFPTPLQRITPYLSTLPEYRSYVSNIGKGLTHTYRLWTEDLNHDGALDLIAGQTLWSQTATDYPTTLQVLLNKGDGTFADATATLAAALGTNHDFFDYSPQFVDIDHSGINTLLFASSTYQGAARQTNYVLLNDGTGKLYVALHDEFKALNETLLTYVKQQYPASGGYYFNDNWFSKFIAVPQADGSLNFVAQVLVGKTISPGVYQDGFALVSAPLAYNPATDFTQAITITDRNGSSLIRTWAGDDVIGDVGGAKQARIDGGAGVDTATYSNALASYQLTVNADGSIAVDAAAIHDTLVNVEKLTFKDGALSTASLKSVSGWFGAILRESASGAHAGLATDLGVAMTAGQKSADAALADVLKQAGSSTSVATVAYQFFTGKIPGAAGIDYLVSPTGPNSANLNSAYYQSFNLENRYINFAVNLGKVGEGAAKFSADYGALSLLDATRKAYAAIFGGTPTDAKVHALIDARVDYFASYGRDGPDGLGTKAAMVGWLMAEAVKADVGVMARSNDAWLLDLADGSAPFAIDILDPAKGYYKTDFVFGGG